MEDTSAPASDIAPIRGASTSRRSFLGTAVGLSGAALVAGAWRPAGEPRLQSPATRSTITRYGLELDGATEPLKSVEGGVIAATVDEAQGASYYEKKHIGPITYEEFEMQVGLSMGTALHSWIDSSWTGQFARKSGAVVLADQNGDAKRRREFVDALVTETAFPACDGTSKEAGHIRVKLAPELIRYATASGKVSGTTTKQKVWVTSNFRFDILGLDATRVSRIDPFSVKLEIAQDSVGESRDFLKQPVKLTFGDLVVTLAESGSADWASWFDDFVVKGNASDSEEKPALLSLLGPDMKEVLAHVHFFNVGIYRFADAPVDGTVSKVTAHLYYERALFHLGPVEPTAPDDPVFCVTCAG